MTKINLFIIVLLCNCIFISCIYDESIQYNETDILHIGDKVPDFRIIDNSGKEINSQQFYGRPTYIVFFNTKCPDCREEFPVIQRFYNDKKNQINFICIARTESDESINEYWIKNNFTMPYSPQDNDFVYKLFAYSGIPRIYVLDKNMIIRSIFTDKDLPTYNDLTMSLTELSL